MNSWRLRTAVVLALCCACSSMSGVMMLRAPLSDAERAITGSERKSARSARIAIAMAVAGFQLETIQTSLGPYVNSSPPKRPGPMVDAQGYLRTLPEEVSAMGPLKPGVNCERMSPDEAQTKAFHEAAARFQTALEKH